MEGIIAQRQPGTAPQPNWSTLTLRIVQTACTVLAVTGTMSAYFRTLISLSSSSFFLRWVFEEYLPHVFIGRSFAFLELRPRFISHFEWCRDGLFIASRLRCHHATVLLFRPPWELNGMYGHVNVCILGMADSFFSIPSCHVP